MKKSEKPSIKTTLSKIFRGIAMPVVSIFGITASQDLAPKDSLNHNGDTFTFSTSDTTKPFIKDRETQDLITAYDSLKVHGISLDSAAALTKNLPDSQKTLVRAWNYFSHTLPKP